MPKFVYPNQVRVCLREQGMPIKQEQAYVRMGVCGIEIFVCVAKMNYNDAEWYLFCKAWFECIKQIVPQRIFVEKKHIRKIIF